MKKSLSVLLAVILLVSCISVGFTGLSIASAEGASYTVTTSVAKQGDLNGGYIKSPASQTASTGGTVTLEAVPYYGNSFAGWYDGDTLVSANAKFDYTVTKNVELKAKFNIYNLIEDGNFATSETNDTSPKFADNIQYGDSKNIPTFKVMSDSTLGTNVVEYLSTAAQNGKTGARKDLVFPFTAKKNTKYVFRYTFKNEEPKWGGFAVKTSNAWGNHATITHSMAIKNHSTNDFYNIHGWSYDYLANAAAKDNFDFRRYLDAVDTTGTDKNVWYDVEIIFDSLENEGTLYFCLGLTEGHCATTYLANMQFSELVELPINGSSKQVDGGSLTVNRDPYISEEYKMISSVKNTNGHKPNYFNNIYTLADKITPTLATAVPASGYAFEGWYDASNSLITKDATSTNYKTTDTPKFVKQFHVGQGGTVVDNGDGTVTAKPFYGNAFLGWYNSTDSLVSKDATLSKEGNIGVTAVFDRRNLVDNGDMETVEAHQSVIDAYNNRTHGNVALKSEPSVENTATTVADSLGTYALKLTSNSTTGNPGAPKEKNAFSLKIDNIKKNTDYIWRFSYKFDDASYNASNNGVYSVYLSANSSSVIDWTESDFDLKWSFHSQRNGSAETSHQFTNYYSWGGGTSFTKSYTNDNGLGQSASAWQDVYFMFNAGESTKIFGENSATDATGTIYLNLGVNRANVGYLLVDNMSVSEAKCNDMSVIKAENGTATPDYPRTAEKYYFYTDHDRTPTYEDPETKTTVIDDSFTSRDTKNVYYPSIYEDFTAVAEPGHILSGWYDEDGKLVSKEHNFKALMTGKKYTAKFVADPNRYTVNTKIETENGVYGGYIKGESSFTELLRDQKVTVTAVPYNGNLFVGWYNGDKLLSTDTTYEHNVNANVTLTAKFTVNNLFTDSGYENSTGSILGTEWSFSKDGAYADISVLETDSGKKVAMMNSAGYEVRSKNFNVIQNKTYHLSMDWFMGYEDGIDGVSTGFEFIKVYNAANNVELGKADTYVPSKGISVSQNSYINFNTGDATQVYIVFKYKGQGVIYIDNLVLYDTATAPFIINTYLDYDGVTHAGYLTSAAVQNVGYNENVTVSVNGYEKNVFLGWYKNGEVVSTNTTYSFKADSFANLTAKFEIKNLVPDSGFEYTPIGESQSDLGNWHVNSTQKVAHGFDVWAAKGPFTGYNGKNVADDKNTPEDESAVNRETINAYDGNNVMLARHRTTTFGTALKGLKENTFYIFSFWWRVQSTGEFSENQEKDRGSFKTLKVTGTKTNELLGNGRAVGVGAVAIGEWQQILIPFNSGNNTEILVDFVYNAASGDCYFDNMSLYESDYITIVQSAGGTIQTDFNGGVSGPAEKGQNITLKAVADPGHTFVGWYDYTDSSKCFGTDTTYTFSADGALAITARWEGPNAEPINYFIDGDFENNCIIPPTFDHPFSGTEWCSYGITTQASSLKAKTGKQFMSLNAVSRYTNFLISNLEPATTYTVSFWYSGDASNEFTNIYVYERYGEYEHVDREHKSQEMNISPIRNFGKTDTYQYAIGSFMPNTIHHSGTWQKGEFTFTTTNRREVYFHIENGGSGNFYFDDMKIVKGNKGGYTDEIINGDFENAYTENGWCRIDNLGNVSTDVNTSNSFDESYALLLPGTTLVKGINLRETSAYTLSFKARTVSNSAVLSFGITKGGTYDLTNAISGAAKSSVTLGSEWNTYTMTFTSQGWLQNNIVFTSGEGAQIDDVTLTKATDLVNAGKVDFESAEQQIIKSNALAAVNQYTKSNSYNKGTYGSGNYAGPSYNEKYYEIVGAAHAHSGNYALRMRKDYIVELDDKGNDTMNTATYTENIDEDPDTKEVYNVKDPKTGFVSHPLNQSWTRFKLRAGKTYTLTYYAKADKKTEFKSMMISVANDWNYAEMASDVVKVGTDWTKITQTFTMIESMTTRNSIAFFCVNGINGKTDSDIYIDDIEIKESASSIITEKETELYTQDISQNYFRNFSFEKAEGELGKYSKAASDAVYGEKIGKFTKGDKLILPIKTRVDYNIEWASEYTFAASVRANSGAKGFVGLAYSPDGTNRLASIKTDKVVNLLSNTKGKWERKGYTFSDYRLGTLYLVIECTAGSFELDYLALFNDNHGYKDFQNDHSVTTFDPKDENNFVDMNTVGKGNYISGVLSGLPSGSKVILKGEKTYESAIDANGAWGFEKIAGGTYDMYIDASDANALTLWGDLTFSDEGVSGLACERLNGDVISIVGEGVRNGIVKIVDDDTEWAYLTATDADGQYNAYILDSNWYIAGTTNIEEALKESGVTTEQFN